MKTIISTVQCCLFKLNFLAKIAIYTPLFVAITLITTHKKKYNLSLVVFPLE